MIYGDFLYDDLVCYVLPESEYRYTKTKQMLHETWIAPNDAIVCVSETRSLSALSA